MKQVPLIVKKKPFETRTILLNFFLYKFATSTRGVTSEVKGN
jgi:hypothetical protein